MIASNDRKFPADEQLEAVDRGDTALGILYVTVVLDALDVVQRGMSAAVDEINAASVSASEGVPISLYK